MMPMVLSATASSMPAFTASRPISSSILPRPQPVTCRILAYRIYLDLLRYELQAMTAFHLRSRDECCSNARAVAKFARKLSRTRRFDPTFGGGKHEAGLSGSMNRVSDPPNAVDRV